MRHEFRLGRGARWFSALGVTLALAAVPSVASAQQTTTIGSSPNQQVSSGATAPGFDPQTTNIPYLAWNGEEVRLEKCVPSYGLTPAEFYSLDTNATSVQFTVEDWSGNNTPQPSVQTNSTNIFYSPEFDDGAGGMCAEGDVVSLNPGMARIEMDVTGFTVPPGTENYDGPSQPFIAHQFLAGWMTLDQPTLTNAADGSSSATVNAGSTPTYLDVKVQGTMPIDGTMQQAVGASSVTLPQDWTTLAEGTNGAPGLATDNNVENTTPWDDWDTSGSNQNVSGHVAGNGCVVPDNPFNAPAESAQPGQYQPVVDNVDNCTSLAGADGPFSTGSGQASDPDTSIGPFDPTNASSTDLADGALNSLDAPMPAARVDVAIAPNTSPSTSTAGVGSLQAADKQVVDSRDGTGNASEPTNLYAPFYDAYIPATARPTSNSSGIDGAYANNFNGFIDIDDDGGLYHFWDIAPLSQQSGSNTSCLLDSSDGHPENPNDPDNDYRSTPSGNETVAVYTDQNGEAQVRYVPGEGYYFDAMGVHNNLDGSCDLESTSIPTLGSASITATAKYPYKAVDYPAQTSSAVTETVKNQFDKSLSSVAKGTGTSDGVERIVIAHAQDIDGSGLSEPVCFSVDKNAESFGQFSGYVNGVYYGNAQPVAAPKGTVGESCLDTDQYGNAAIYVKDSNGGTVDVTADFVDEGILRDIHADFTSTATQGTPPSTPVTQPSQSGSTGSGTGTTTPYVPLSPVGSIGTTEPPLAAVAKVNPTLAQQITSHKAVSARATLQSVRLFTPARGAHYLVLRVKSSQSSVRVLLTLKIGHKTVHRTISVPANQSVKITMPKSVKRIMGAHLIG